MIAAILAFFGAVFQDLAASTAAVAVRRAGVWVWRRARGLPILAPQVPGGDKGRLSSGAAAQASAGRSGKSEKRAVAERRRLKDSTVFFSRRFAEAFPGCRGLCEFSNPREALHRLDILLRDPISVDTDGATYTPMWWFRGGSALHIESYRRERILLFETNNFYFSDIEYFKMKRIVAFNEGSYFRNFVYVEVNPLPPTGIYASDTAGRAERIGLREEYGEYGRFWKRRVTRAEYDDGATVVRGRVKDITGKVRLRVRMLSQYNFVLAPHLSPMNYRDAEHTIENLLDGILNGQATMRDLADLAQRLPRHRRDD